MNILVVDVAADSGGALSVLNQFYEELQDDTGNHYYFCVSLPELQDQGNITVLRFPWVKKSWLHRLWFEYVVGPRLVVDRKIDEILSLQNTVFPRTKIPQRLYLHQPLPFSSIRFRLRQHPKLWVYQNLISHLIYGSIKRASRVTVQTRWMRDAVIAKTGIPSDKIQLVAPKLDATDVHSFRRENYRNLFFYPASGLSYKNHLAIVKACVLLHEKGIRDFQVAITIEKTQLTGDCSRYLPVATQHMVFLGQISRDEVMDYYSKSILLFPSYIETFGLPLLEARQAGAPILTSHCPFSTEILEGYENAAFFDPFQPEQLATLMEAQLLQ